LGMRLMGRAVGVVGWGVASPFTFVLGGGLLPFLEPFASPLTFERILGSTVAGWERVRERWDVFCFEDLDLEGGSFAIQSVVEAGSVTVA
jgi:hypothetical protein